MEYSERPLWMFNCSCTEKDNHNKCEKLERFGSITDVLGCC